MSAARNTGMDAASGDYIWFVDSDDFVQDNCLNKMREITQSNEVDYISFGFYFFDEVLSDSELKLKEEGRIKTNSKLRAPTSSIFRSEMIKKIKWHEGIEVGEDSIFIRELDLLNPNIYKLDCPLYFYRQQSASVTHTETKDPIRRLNSHVCAAKIMKEIFENPNGNSEANANFLMMFIVFAMCMIARLIGVKEYRTAAKNYLREMKYAGLFPFKKPVECTKTKSFLVERNDVIGRLLDCMFMHSCTKVGFAVLVVWYKIYGIIKH